MHHLNAHVQRPQHRSVWRLRLQRVLAATLTAGLAVSGVLIAAESAHAETMLTTYVNTQSGNTATVVANVIRPGVFPPGSVLASGTWVCTGTFSIPYLKVDGAVNLILADDCDMTVTNTGDAIRVMSGNSLTVYSGVNNTGKLTAIGNGFGNAGIGSSAANLSGAITLRGGSITATGGPQAPGIGAGWQQITDSPTVGSAPITIEWRASVDATGGDGSSNRAPGPGIGVGANVHPNIPDWPTIPPGPITINTTGLVRATGGGPGTTSFPNAPNIGSAGRATSPSITSQPTATVNNPSVTGNGTVQMLNTKLVTVAKAAVTNVARGSAVTYLATPTAGYRVKSAIGNGTTMVKGSTNGNTTQYRHAVAAIPPTSHATAFEFEPDMTLALAASPASPQNRPGDVTLTATLTNGGVAVTNRTVSFTIDGITQVLTGTTNSSGVATFTVPSPLAGTHTFQAVFAGDSNYAAVNSLQINGYLVQRIAQYLTLNGVAHSYIYGDTPEPILASSLGSGALTLTSSAPSVASIADAGDGFGTLTLQRAGSFAVTAARAQDDTYNAVSTTSPTATVSAATAVVELTRVGGNITTENTDLSVLVKKRGIGETPSGTVEFFLDSVSQGTVQLVPNQDGDAVAALPTFTVGAFGSHTAEVRFSGDAGRYSAGSDSTQWHADRADQDTPLAINDPGMLTFGDANFTLSTTGGSGSGAVTWEVHSDPGVLEVDPNTGVARIVGAGEVSVRATKAEDSTYNELAANLTFTVLPFDLAGVTAATIGSPYVYQATQIRPDAQASFIGLDTVAHTLIAGSDFTLSYAENTLVSTGGTLTLHASSANYTGSKDVNFAIQKAQPTLLLQGVRDGTPIGNQFELPGQLSMRATFAGVGVDVADKTITLDQVAGQNLGLSFDDSTNAGGQLASPDAATNPTLGNYTFTAEFDGDENYLASSTNLDIEVILGTLNITVAGVSTAQNYGDGPLTLSLLGLPDQGAGAVSFASSDPSVATVVNNQLTILRAGTVAITGFTAIGSLYNAATSPPLTVTVNPATPLVTLSHSGGATPAHALILSAAVTRPAGTAEPLVGSVTFFEGATELGTEAIGANGVATFTIASPAIGDHLFTARFNGQTNFYAVTTSAEHFMRVPGAPQPDFAIVPPSESETVYGHTPLTLGLTGQLGTGEVTWSINPESSAAWITETTGVLTILAAGTVTVQATIANDPVYDGTTATHTVVIRPRPVTVTAEDHTITFGESPSLSWTIAPPLIGTDTLSGSIKVAAQIRVGVNAIVEDETFANSNYAVTFVPGNLTVLATAHQQEVIDIIEDLPSPVRDHADADKVADATKEYNKLSEDERAGLPEDVVEALKKAQDEAGKVNHSDDGQGVSADGEHLPWYVRMFVVRVPASDSRFQGVSRQVDAPRALIDLYDIYFVNTLTEERWQPAPNEPVEIRLTKVDLRGFASIGVVHEQADGSLERIDSAALDGSVVRFDGASFSMYGVTGIPVPDLAHTGAPAAWVAGLTGLFLIACGALMLRRRKSLPTQLN